MPAFAWSEAQSFESAFWGNCTNTLIEELKQSTYARYMGLIATHDPTHDFCYDLAGASVLDLGGGPVSLLLKCTNLGAGSRVVDPCPFPPWVGERYRCAGLDLIPVKAEEIPLSQLPSPNSYAEAWIYNVLQHVDDPAKIIANAKTLAPRLRIFEWINFPAYAGHPQALTAAKLEAWIGQPGSSTLLQGENGCHGQCFYGNFVHAAAPPR